jgi:hypothetical protein
MKKVIIIVILICANIQLIAMQQNQIDISGLDKVKLLQALFDRAKPQENSFVYYHSNNKLGRAGAENVLRNGHGYVDHVAGKVMKVNISDDRLDPFLFNTHNGAGAAEQVIQNLRAEQQ